ncbi:hypothetical protein K2Q08_00525 [Patescibacteria group bacterium]|nr:hypothetical protein [Patescibacteria group bacterium]
MNIFQRGFGFKVNFKTFLPIADELLLLSVNFIEWQATIITTKKPDGTPVSSADKNAQRLVKNVLRKMAPHIPVRGEEDSKPLDCVTKCRGKYWSVDPIDGTRFYEAMKDDWCVSVALIVDGEPFAAIVIQPGRGECFVGIKSMGVQFRTQHGTWKEFVRKDAVNPMLVVPTSRSVLCNDIYRMQAVRLTAHFENTFSAPSVLAALEIVRGHAWGWVSLFRPWHWDIAAVFVLVREMGGVALCTDGKPIPWNEERIPPVVFAASLEKAAAIGWALNQNLSPCA